METPTLQKPLLSIPDSAREVFFYWEITPSPGRVPLYRTPIDTSPQELTGPVGNVTAGIGDVSVICGWLAIRTKGIENTLSGGKDKKSEQKIRMREVGESY